MIYNYYFCRDARHVHAVTWISAWKKRLADECVLSSMIIQKRQWLSLNVSGYLVRFLLLAQTQPDRQQDSNHSRVFVSVVVIVSCMVLYLAIAIRKPANGAHNNKWIYSPIRTFRATLSVFFAFAIKSYGKSKCVYFRTATGKYQHTPKHQRMNCGNVCSVWWTAVECLVASMGYFNACNERHLGGVFESCHTKTFKRKWDLFNLFVRSNSINQRCRIQFHDEIEKIAVRGVQQLSFTRGKLFTAESAQ